MCVLATSTGRLSSSNILCTYGAHTIQPPINQSISSFTHPAFGPRRRQPWTNSGISANYEMEIMQQWLDCSVAAGDKAQNPHQHFISLPPLSFTPFSVSIPGGGGLRTVPYERASAMLGSYQCTAILPLHDTYATWLHTLYRCHSFVIERVSTLLRRHRRSSISTINSNSNSPE